MSSSTTTSSTPNSRTSSNSEASNPLTGGKGSTRRNKMQMMYSRSRGRYAAVAGGRRNRKMRGGQSYSSASSYGSYVNGSGESQWDRVFTGSSPTPYGNEIVGVQGQNSVIPASVHSSGNLSGGKRRSKGGQTSLARFQDGFATFGGKRKTLSKKGGQTSLARFQDGSATLGGKRKTRSKKGGYWAQVINQALVPFGLWGLQNRYGKRHTRKN